MRDCHASDLQCAAALDTPRELDFGIHGIDLCTAVIEEAQRHAAEQALAHSSTTERPGYAYDRSHEVTLRALTARSDDLAQEVIVPREELEA